MINTRIRIHDKFSVEFKTAYIVDKTNEKNEFSLNTWIFVPYSLEINSATYSYNDFYRDVKSYVRLITPVYTLKQVGDRHALPYRFLEVAFNELVDEPSEDSMAEFEYQIKMFISIAKSALRQEGDNFVKKHNKDEIEKETDIYIDKIQKVISLYRGLKPVITQPNVSPKALQYFSFGDEFFSNRIEHKTFEILNVFKTNAVERYDWIEKKCLDLIKQERQYRLDMGYGVIIKDNPKENSQLLFRLRLLKKYVENHLFLNAKKKKDGRLAEQVSFSIAAGLAMIFTTAVAFSVQQKYGNFTMPLFVALVVAYMLKDRIKELVRYYFASQLSRQYFDSKTFISIKNDAFGWIKDAMNFVPESTVPEEVIHLRNRSDILESDNRNTEEKIMLYRKFIRINGKELERNIQHDISGVNDIFRFNFSSFITKMDDPVIPVFVPSDKDGYEIVKSKFIYYINFITQLKSGKNSEFKRFRLTISRDGIEKIDEF